jgi:hypothetical protein
MAVITGTLVDFKFGEYEARNDSTNSVRRRRVHLLYQFTAGTAGDTGLVEGIAAIAVAKSKNGKTYTLRGAANVCSRPGQAADGTLVYAGTIAVSSADLTCTLGTAVTGAAASTAATVQPVGIDAYLDESL